MTKYELMQLSPQDAVDALSWESIEYLFRPSNILELLLRVSYYGTMSSLSRLKQSEYLLKTPAWDEVDEAIASEKFYREMTRVKNPDG